VKRNWTWTRVALGAIALVAAGLFWFNFAPTSEGGDAIYVSTSGISMEPRFHTGDLAILHPQSSYKIGEIVGYRSAHIGIVLHRIIGEKAGHFLMKGDNNDFIDEYHPAPSDVVGRLWLHVPKVGRLMNTPRKRDISVVVALAVVAGAVAMPAGRRRRRRRKGAGRGDSSAGDAKGFRPASHRSSSRHSSSHQLDGGGPIMGVLGLPGQLAASAICVVALLALLLGAVSFTRSTTTVKSEHLSYRQTGTWSYSAPAKGDVYSNGVATTGQPIFLALAPVVKVVFAYSFVSALPTNLSGRAGLTAVFTSPSGWTKTLPLGPEASFSGTRVQVTGTLNLPTIESLLTRIETQIGPVPGSNGSYTMTLESAVHVSGVLGGTPLLRQSFNPSLSFTLQGNEAQLSNGQGTSVATLAQLVRSSSSGFTSVARTTPAQLSFLGQHPSVALSRKIAAGVLLACLVALFGLGILLWRASRAAETARIGARYGSILVAVERPEALGEAGSVRVANMDDLVKIAEHQGRMILHCAGESGRDYFVRDQALTYLYSARDQPSRRRPSQASATDPAAPNNGLPAAAVPVVTPDSATNHVDTGTSSRDRA
jgi:signal peptidase I